MLLNERKWVCILPARTDRPYGQQVRCCWSKARVYGWKYLHFWCISQSVQVFFTRLQTDRHPPCMSVYGLLSCLWFTPRPWLPLLTVLDIIPELNSDPKTMLFYIYIFFTMLYKLKLFNCCKCKHFGSWLLLCEKTENWVQH